MKLYHIALGWQKETKEFIPRIPKLIAVNENKEIKRICLSDSIEGCLSAIPYKPQNSMSKKKITIYKGDFDKYIGYKELYFSGKVPDAYLTHEHWILDPVQMTGKHVYLKNFESNYEYVPDEKKHQDFIKNTISILRKNKYKNIKELILVLQKNTMAEAMLTILPEIMNSYLIDWDDICGDILNTTRLVLEPEILTE